MKTLFPVLLFVLALPLHAEIRGGVRIGSYQGNIAGTVEIDARHGNWSLSPALDVIRGGYDLHAWHVDVRRIFNIGRTTSWIGAGPSFVRSNQHVADNTWNVDAGLALRAGAWEPFIAARYYTYDMPVRRDVIKGTSGVISIGIARRF
jgi:hypothetical protein